MIHTKMNEHDADKTEKNRVLVWRMLAIAAFLLIASIVLLLFQLPLMNSPGFHV
jgi:type IV secretory pathway component VirB8